MDVPFDCAVLTLSKLTDYCFVLLPSSFLYDPHTRHQVLVSNVLKLLPLLQHDADRLFAQYIKDHPDLIIEDLCASTCSFLYSFIEDNFDPAMLASLRLLITTQFTDALLDDFREHFDGREPQSIDELHSHVAEFLVSINLQAETLHVCYDILRSWIRLLDVHQVLSFLNRDLKIHPLDHLDDSEGADKIIRFDTHVLRAA